MADELSEQIYTASRGEESRVFPWQIMLNTFQLVTIKDVCDHFNLDIISTTYMFDYVPLILLDLPVFRSFLITLSPIELLLNFFC